MTGVLFMPEFPTAVYWFTAGKIRWQAILGNIRYRIALNELLLQLKTIEIVGENQQTTRLQSLHGQIQQLHLGLLHIEEPLHALGI